MNKPKTLSAVARRGLAARKLTRRVKASTKQMLKEIRSGYYQGVNHD